MSAELIGRARDVAKYQTYGDIDNLLRALADALETAEAKIADAWDEGHAAGRDYQGDGWNSDAHDPADDNPYRKETT